MRSGTRFATKLAVAAIAALPQGCGGKTEKKTGNPSDFLTIAWTTAPSLDAACRLSLPGETTFSAYTDQETSYKKPFNSKKTSSIKMLSKFDAASGKLTLDTAASICAHDPEATENGLSCTVNSFPLSLDASPGDWYAKRKISASWTVRGAAPSAEKTLKRTLDLSISEQQPLAALAPANPPTLDTNNYSGAQVGCSVVGCLPGALGGLALGGQTAASSEANFSCAINAADGVSCWGANNLGQLGNGTTSSSNVATDVTSLGNVRQITAGSNFACALISDGTVKCWGANSGGLLGTGTQNSTEKTPQPVPGLANVVMIGAGAYHVCALINDGTVKCWGYNEQRQVAYSSTLFYTTPTEVAGISGAVSLGIGGFHSCAVLSDGSAKCWGYNHYGQIGDGTADGDDWRPTPASPVLKAPVAVVGLTSIKAISSGYSHTCALLDSGAVSCWGSNDPNRLGSTPTSATCPNINSDGSSQPTDWCVPVPTTVTGISTAVAVSAGVRESCFLLGNGSIRCVGFSGGMYAVDRAIELLPKNAVAVASGLNHSCALLSDSSVRCWGYNTSGQLGNGATTELATPVYADSFHPAAVVTEPNRPLSARHKACHNLTVSVE